MTRELKRWQMHKINISRDVVYIQGKPTGDKDYERFFPFVLRVLYIRKNT